MKKNRQLFVLILFVLVFTPVFAKKKKDKDFTRVIQASSKAHIYDPDQNIPRSKFDVTMEEIIEARFGDKYRRANVYDFYPEELPERKARGMDDADQMELMDYYEYARKDLQKLNQSKFLKVMNLDFNLDGTKDYAVIVHDVKANDNYLAVINREEVLHLERFEANYLEPVNAGHYPTKVVYGKGKKRMTISTPAIRLVAFDEKSKVLYYDKPKKKWQTLELDD